jgi:hypothetical protein
MKNNKFLITALILGAFTWSTGMLAASYGRMVSITNNSPWFVKFQSNDPTRCNFLGWPTDSSGNVNTSACKLFHQGFILGPKNVGPSSISATNDFVVPYQVIGGQIADAKIDIWVLGASADGRPVNVSHGILADQAGVINLIPEEGLVTPAQFSKQAGDVAVSVTIQADGTITAQQVK